MVGCFAGFGAASRHGKTLLGCFAAEWRKALLQAFRKKPGVPDGTAAPLDRGTRRQTGAGAAVRYGLACGGEMRDGRRWGGCHRTPCAQRTVRRNAPERNMRRKPKMMEIMHFLKFICTFCRECATIKKEQRQAGCCGEK